MHLDTFIIDLALIMVASALISILFRKLKLPTVLGYITAGFLISPNFTLLPTVVETENINTWATIGIVFLMFALGLEFSFKRLSSVGSSAIITALTVMSGMIFVGTALGRALGFAKMDCIFLGCMLSMSSTMIIMKAVEEYGLKKERSSTLVLGALVVEDVGGIFLIIILSTISVGKSVSGAEMISQLGVMLLMLVVWLALGIYLIPSVLKRTRRLLNDELLLILALAICFGMVVISHYIGFSEALGAFMGGSIIAGTVSGERVDELVHPLKDMFGAVFFVSVGMMIIPHYLVDYWLPILIISGVTILGQMCLVTIGILLSGQSLHTAVKGGSMMVQIGEFSFIIASLGVTLGATSEFLLPVVVLVAVITIFLTPVFVKTAEARYGFILVHSPKWFRNFLNKYTTERRDRTDNTSDWQRYLRTYISRTLVLGAILFLLYYAGYTRVLPFLVARFGEVLGEIMTGIGVLILMIPFVSLMMGRRGNMFKKLWLMNTTNRLPLMLLRILRMVLCAFFIGMLLWRVFHIHILILIPLILVLLVLVVRSDFLRGRSLNIEARFVANFNEKILHSRKAEWKSTSWIEDQLYIVQFGLSEAGLCTTVRLILEDRVNDVLIIKILRDGKHINMPGPNEEVCTGDTLYALAGKEQLEGYIKALEREEHIREPEGEMVSLKDFIYAQTFHGIAPEDQIMACAIPATKDLPFTGKSIKNSGFKDEYHGFIVALERQNLTIIDPPVDTLIRDKDLVWALGGQEMAKRLLEDGLLNE